VKPHHPKIGAAPTADFDIFSSIRRRTIATVWRKRMCGFRRLTGEGFEKKFRGDGLPLQEESR